MAQNILIHFCPLRFVLYFDRAVVRQKREENEMGRHAAQGLVQYQTQSAEVRTRLKWYIL